MRNKIKAGLLIIGMILLYVIVAISAIVMGDYFIYGFCGVVVIGMLYFLFTMLVEQFDRETPESP